MFSYESAKDLVVEASFWSHFALKPSHKLNHVVQYGGLGF